jgi:hypothetical protein
MYKVCKKWSLITLMVVAVCGAGSISAKDPSVEEIIKKHLDSIGTSENRAKMTNIITGGVGQFESRTPVVKGGGRAVIVSDANNFYFQMSLNSNNYPFEKIGNFDGKVTLPFVVSGERSALGSFLNEHQQIIGEGVFGGALSMMWIRNIANVEKFRMRAAGAKKVGDTRAWVLEAQSLGKGSSEFKARFYFDAATFQHIRSEFRREIRAGVIFNGRRNAFNDGYLLLTEDFSDFKANEGITLPAKYVIKFQSDSPELAYENTWTIQMIGARFNQQLAPDFFAF